MTDITDFPIKPYGKETPDRLLKAFNSDGIIEDVVILGVDKSGDIRISSSFEDYIEMVGLVEISKQNIIQGTE